MIKVLSSYHVAVSKIKVTAVCYVHYSAVKFRKGILAFTAED